MTSTPVLGQELVPRVVGAVVWEVSGDVVPGVGCGVQVVPPWRRPSGARGVGGGWAPVAAGGALFVVEFVFVFFCGWVGGVGGLWVVVCVVVLLLLLLLVLCWWCWCWWWCCCCCFWYSGGGSGGGSVGGAAASGIVVVVEVLLLLLLLWW